MKRIYHANTLISVISNTIQVREDKWIRKHNSVLRIEKDLGCGSKDYLLNPSQYILSSMISYSNGRVGLKLAQILEKIKQGDLNPAYVGIFHCVIKIKIKTKRERREVFKLYMHLS